MIRTKAGILERLKDVGYSTYTIRKEKILGERTVQQIRDGKPVSGAALDIVCRLLRCQPGDILEYVPDDDTDKA